LDLTELKQQARAAATRRRRAAAEIDDGSAASAVGDLLLETLDVDPSAVASGYIPIGSELDVRSVLGRLRRRGHTIVLPSVREKGHPLVFREWVLGDPLVREPFGTLAPPESAPRHSPDLLLVPLLAFDRDGYRLGYGGGFYDRTLDRLRARKEVTAVGVAFAAQELDSVPHDSSDARLDLIVTENEVIRP
jgi:5-formyltetrahydrofolate cyclo-ligase